MVTWKQSDVTAPGRRPGTFVNFGSRAQALIRGGLTGVVAATVKAGWGPTDRVVPITTLSEMTRYFSSSEELFDTSLTDDISNRYNAPFIIENLLAGGVSKVIVRRLVGAGSVASELTLADTTTTPVNVITVVAKYPGRWGDTFKVQIVNTPSAMTQQISLRDNDNNVIATWVSTVNRGVGSGIVDNLINMVNGDDDNDYITLVKIDNGNGTLATTSFTALSGGDGDEDNIVISDYDEAQSDFSLEKFEMVYLDSDDATIRADMVSWVQIQRNEGKAIQLVTGSALGESVDTAVTNAGTTIDQPFVSYIWPGFKRNDRSGVERTYPGYLAAARVAGILAGLPLISSPTFQSITLINDLETRAGNSDIRALLAGGVMPLVWDGTRYKIERGINTLIPPYTSLQNESYSKVKVMRILDNINNAINTSISDTYIGKINNDSEGRKIAFDAIRQFLGVQESADLILPNFTVELDPDNAPTIDGFFTLIGIQPIDSVEFMYFTILVG